jgi:hypothetical protein
VAPREIALRRASCWLEDATNGLSACFRALLAALYRDLQWLDERVVSSIGDRRDRVEDEAVRRIEQLRGIGPLIASALSRWSVTDGSSEWAAVGVALGLTPRQHSSAARTSCSGSASAATSTSHTPDPSGHARRYVWRLVSRIG